MSNQTVTELRGELRTMRQEVRAAQVEAQRAQERAILAERSAREAWGFVKALRGTPQTTRIDK